MQARTPTRQGLSASLSPGNRLVLPSSAPQAPPPRYSPPPTTRRSLGECVWRQGDAHVMPCQAPALFPIQASTERLGWQQACMCHALGSTRDHSRAKRGRLASGRACTAACTPHARGLQVTAQRCCPGAQRCFSAHRRGCPARRSLSAQSCRRQLLAPWPAAPRGLRQGEHHGKHPALARWPAAP